MSEPIHIRTPFGIATILGAMDQGEPRRAPIKLVNEDFVDSDTPTSDIAQAPGNDFRAPPPGQKVEPASYTVEEPRNPMFRPGSATDVRTSNKRGYAPDLSHVNPRLMTSFMATQKDFGQQLPIVSGFRDTAFNAKVGGAKNSAHTRGDALDIDVSGMSISERQRLIRAARKHGMGGIGVYENSLHFDVEGRRQWGPSYHSDSVPDWAWDALNG